MRANLIAPVALITGLAISIQLVAGSPGDDLRALCSGGDIDLTTVTQVRNLLDKLYTDQGIKCSAFISNVLHALASVVEGDEACTMERARAIKNFSVRFIQNEAEGNLPRPLARFAIAYGMKVAAICKRHMLTKFLKQSEQEIMGILGKDDFREFQKYLIFESPLGQALTPILKQSEVILPSDLTEVMPQFNKNIEGFLTREKNFAPFKRLCANFLEPFYRPMMLPLAELSSAGFDHRELGSRISAAWTNFLSDDQLKRDSKFWSLAVFACEQAENIDVDESDQEAAADSSNLVAPDNHRYRQPLPDYKVEEKVSDTIISLADLPLQAKVLLHAGHRDEVTRLEKKISDRSMSVFKQMSKKGMHKNYILFSLKNLVFPKKIDADFETARSGLVKLSEQSRENSKVYAAMNFGSEVGRNYKTVAAMTVGIPAIVVATCTGSSNSVVEKFIQRF